MHNVKLIRMQTGEDIMASIFEHEDSDQVLLNDPMRLVFRRMPTGQTVMMMMPWLPVELIKQNSATIYSSDIITMIEPKETMIQYYDKLVERTAKDIADADQLLEQLLEEQESEETEAQELSEQLNDFLEDFKSKKLH